MDSGLFNFASNNDAVVSSPNISNYLTGLVIKTPAYSYITGSNNTVVNVPTHTFYYNDAGSSTVDSTATLAGNATSGYTLNLVDGDYNFNLVWKTDNNVVSSSNGFDTTPNLVAASSYEGYRPNSTNHKNNFDGNDVLVCYAKGTHITTDRGPVAVEDLQVGDLVLTVSGKYEPISWLGHR
ncbi:Hint domain-containing protein, partial [Polynucleobacter sp. UK-Pondora-W15]|nr:Hint domain-containing protein [Polynucleobacter alcilacus]